MGYLPIASPSGANLNVPLQSVSMTDGDLIRDSVDGFKTRVDGLPMIMRGCIYRGTSDKTVTNTTAFTSCVPSGTGTLLIPSTFWKVGRTIFMQVSGIYSTPVAVSSVLSCQLKLGSQVLSNVSTSSLLTGAANLNFEARVNITCRAIGATGVLSVTGIAFYVATSAGLTAANTLSNDGLPFTCDLTTDKIFDCLVSWDSASTGKILKSTSFTAEVV